MIIDCVIFHVYAVFIKKLRVSFLFKSVNRYAVIELISKLEYNLYPST